MPLLKNPLRFVGKPWVPRERVTNAVPNISSNHAQIHQGNAFSFSDHSRGIVAGGSVGYVIDIPAGTYVHFQAANMKASGHGLVELVELAGYSGEGTLIPAVNRHRSLQSKNSSLTVRKNVTSVVEDIAMELAVVGSPGNGNAGGVGGELGNDREWNLEPGKSYLVRCTNLESSSAIDFSLTPFWYEEDGY